MLFESLVDAIVSPGYYTIGQTIARFVRLICEITSLVDSILDVRTLYSQLMAIHLEKQPTTYNDFSGFLPLKALKHFELSKYSLECVKKANKNNMKGTYRNISLTFMWPMLYAFTLCSVKKKLCYAVLKRHHTQQTTQTRIYHIQQNTIEHSTTQHYIIIILYAHIKSKIYANKNEYTEKKRRKRKKKKYKHKE